MNSGNIPSLKSSSDGDSDDRLQRKMDGRREKRMQSSRESARRSRMRKRKHFDDLLAQATAFRHENGVILSRINASVHQFLRLEGENGDLRAQILDLRSRLEGLLEMLECMHELGDLTLYFETLTQWNGAYYIKQAITASADKIPILIPGQDQYMHD